MIESGRYVGSFPLMTCFMQIIQQRRVGGAKDASRLADASRLDSCDKHRNEGAFGSLKI